MSPNPTTTIPGESLAEFTRSEWIIPRVREKDTAGVVHELSQLLHLGDGVPDVLAFYHAAMNHEFLVNSATECGIALPHARLKGIANSRFAFGLSPEPLRWGAYPSRPVHFIFLLAVPATDAAGFLQLLSSLARLGHEPALLDELRQEGSVEGILELFQRIRVGNP